MQTADAVTGAAAAAGDEREGAAAVGDKQEDAPLAAAAVEEGEEDAGADACSAPVVRCVKCHRVPPPVTPACRYAPRDTKRNRGTNEYVPLFGFTIHRISLTHAHAPPL